MVSDRDCPAYQNNHSNNDDYIVNASRFKTNITMNYVVSRFVTLNYLFVIVPAGFAPDGQVTEKPIQG